MEFAQFFRMSVPLREGFFWVIVFTSMGSLAKLTRAYPAGDERQAGHLRPTYTISVYET